MMSRTKWSLVFGFKLALLAAIGFGAGLLLERVIESRLVAELVSYAVLVLLVGAVPMGTLSYREYIELERKRSEEAPRADGAEEPK